MHRGIGACLAAAVLAASVACGPGQARGTDPFGTYAALGDSYTAAPGLRPVADAACGRSAQNYPHLVAARLRARLVDVSCSGAVLADLRVGDVPRGAALVTIGVGGNDLDLVGVAKACLDGGCADRLPSLVLATDSLTDRLAAFVGEVRRRAPGARVVVVGYPGHAFAAGSCAAYPARPDGLVAARVVFLLLDDALRTAATRAKADFIDLGEASRQHGICSTDPWVAGVDGVGAQPLPPLPAEQEYVASRIAALVRP